MLARIALRIAAVEALRGATLVGDNVLDSQIGALDADANGMIRTDQQKPFISVYVEGSKAEGDVSLRAIHRNGLAELMFEIGVTAAMTEHNEETDETKLIGLGIPATDPALELQLDITCRQIVNALTDPDNVWSEVWRKLHRNIVKIERRRTSSGEGGTRIAAHQMIFTVDLLADPVYGEPVAPGSAWRAFFDQMDAAGADDPLMATKATALRGLIGTPPANGSAATAKRRRFNITLDELRALGDMPPPEGEATEPDISLLRVEKQ